MKNQQQLELALRKNLEAQLAVIELLLNEPSLTNVSPKRLGTLLELLHEQQSQTITDVQRVCSALHSPPKSIKN